MKIEDRIKQLKTQRQVTETEVDKVLKKRSTGTRAIAAYELWLKLNPQVEVSFSDGTSQWMTARQVDAETRKKVAFLKEMQANKFGTNKTGSMRLALELPPPLAHFIKLFHPDVFDNDAAAKSRLHKLVKAFPQYQVYERM